MEALTRAFSNFAQETVLQAPKILAALIVFVGFATVGLVLQQIVKRALRRPMVAPRIRLLVGRLVFGCILAVGAIVFLAVVTDASLGRVLTGFGLFSVALGFALKGPLENVFAGVLTILTAPFRIGDEVEIGGHAGKVETINIHDTIIRTFDGKRVAIPNLQVYSNAVTDQTAFSFRRYDVLVGVHYGDDIRKALTIAHEVLSSTPGIRDEPEPQVLVGKLNEYSVDLILRFWSGPTMQRQFQVTSDVTLNIKLAFDREGITIPFPIRTLQLPEDAGKLQVQVFDENTHSNGRSTSDSSPD